MTKKTSCKVEQRDQKDIKLVQTLKNENESLLKGTEEFAGQVNTLTVDLEISRLEFIHVFDAVSDPLCIIDTNHNILRVNSMFVDFFNFKNKEFVVGKKCYEILNYNLCRTDNCPLVYIKNKRERIEIETKTNLKIKKNNDVDVLLTGDPLIGLAHETIGAVLQFKDISERKAYEKALEKTNKKLERLASIDGLTQIPNRRIFNETIGKEWRRMQRSNQSIALLMIDIDYFKLYNDNYGHAQGDECLKQVAHAISSCFHRSHDLAARYGGEEFGCILPETDLKGAVTVADSVLNAVRDCKISHEYSTVTDIVTVSIGCFCMFPESKDKYVRLINEADKLLYKSKELGRNRVTNNKKPYQKEFPVEILLKTNHNILSPPTQLNNISIA